MGCSNAVEFHLPSSPLRDRIIRKIFTGGHDNTTRNDDALTITLQMIASIFRDQSAPFTTGARAPELPRRPVEVPSCCAAPRRPAALHCCSVFHHHLHPALNSQGGFYRGCFYRPFRKMVNTPARTCGPGNEAVSED
jgi:hypothetical protein